MADFDVTVCRIGIGFRTLRVRDCKDAAEAGRKAEEIAPNLEFSDKDASYEVEACLPVEGEVIKQYEFDFRPPCPG